MEDDDFLDHGEILDEDKLTADDDLIGIQLFADVDWEDDAAVEQRKEEYRELSNGSS